VSRVEWSPDYRSAPVLIEGIRDDNLPELLVAVVGSRDADPLFLRPVIDKIVREARGTHRVVIVSGGARGIDTEAVNYAQRIGLRTIVVPANWERDGKRAGVLRNLVLIERADRVVAFWDGESKGTKHTINEALKHGKPLEVVPCIKREVVSATRPTR
jgi:hypothetical protein